MEVKMIITKHGQDQQDKWYCMSCWGGST